LILVPVPPDEDSGGVFELAFALVPAFIFDSICDVLHDHIAYANLATPLKFDVKTLATYFFYKTMVLLVFVIESKDTDLIC
jgi:hypothetical protein